MLPQPSPSWPSTGLSERQPLFVCLILRQEKLQILYIFCTASMAERLTRVPRVHEVRSLNPRPTKSYTALQTVRHRFNIYAGSCFALAL